MIGVVGHGRAPSRIGPPRSMASAMAGAVTGVGGWTRGASAPGEAT